MCMAIFPSQKPFVCPYHFLAIITMKKQRSDVGKITCQQRARWSRPPPLSHRGLGSVSGWNSKPQIHSFFHSFIKYMCTVTAVHKSLCWVLSRHWTTRASVCSPGEGRSIRRQGKPMHWAQSTKSISPPGNCWGLLELNTWSMEERVTWEVTEGYGSISLLYLILRNWIVCVCVCVCVCVFPENNELWGDHCLSLV